MAFFMLECRQLDFHRRKSNTLIIYDYVALFLN
ncbi:MAG: hypothetical protein ACI935_003772, partial [Moritella dasanensis]